MNSTHPMQIRSKSGIFKPKLLSTRYLQEPPNASIALTIPYSKKAMGAEYNALVNNQTWKFVPYFVALFIVQFQ